MGNFESKNENESFQFLKNLEEIKEVKDKRFHNGKIFCDKNNNYFLLCNRYSFNKEDNDYLHHLIQKRINLNHPNLCQIKINNKEVEDNWYSQDYKVSIVSEFFDSNLETETNALKRLPDNVDEKKFVPEPDLWYLISILSKIVFDLKQKDMYHGDIQPMNILINKNDKIKLFESSLLNHSYSGFERMITDPNYYTTLSPENIKLLKKIKKKQKDNNKNENIKISKIDKEQSEMFSIGITVLALAVNDYITQFYDYESFEIKFQKIEEDFEFMEGLGYSNEIINTLSNLLSKNPKNRYSSKKLLSNIKDNQLI